MTPHKRIEITFETEWVVIVRRRRSGRTWCDECRSEVEMLTLEDLGTATGMTLQAIRNAAKEQHWHLRDGNQGTVVCLQSMKSE